MMRDQIPTTHWRSTIALLTFALALLAGTQPVYAHRIYADALIQNGTIVVEAYFSDDSPLREARVTVQGPEGALLSTGQTDSDGRYHFLPKEAVDLLVVIDDGLGHRLEGEIPAARIEPILGKTVLPPEREAPIASSKPSGLSALGPLWLRVIVGLLVIALMTSVAAWFHRHGRRPGAR